MRRRSSKYSKACDISKAVQSEVKERDNDGLCIFCGRPGNPNMHYISRPHGGLGIPQNIATGCMECHGLYDGIKRKEMRIQFENYLRSHYPDWDKEALVYRKYKFGD